MASIANISKANAGMANAGVANASRANAGTTDASVANAGMAKAVWPMPAETPGGQPGDSQGGTHRQGEACWYSQGSGHAGHIGREHPGWSTPGGSSAEESYGRDPP